MSRQEQPNDRTRRIPAGTRRPAGLAAAAGTRGWVGARRWAGLAAAALALALLPGAGASAARRQAALPTVAQAQAEAKAGRFGTAGALLRRRLSARPTDDAARFLLARVLTWAGKPQAALEEYGRLLRRSPRSADYLLGKAQALVAAGREEDALPVLRTARAAAPRYEDVYRLEIRILAGRQENEQLAALLKAAKRNCPGVRWDEVASAGRAAPPAPVPPAAKSPLLDAQHAANAGDLDRAAALIQPWVQTHARDEDARYLLARVLGWQGKAEQSLAEYDRLLALSPRNSDYLLGKAQVLLRQGRPADALPLLDRAREISPRYEDVHRARLQALRRLGDAEKLAAALKEAAALFPGSDWGDLASLRDPKPLEDARAAVAGRRFADAEKILRDWLARYPQDDPSRLLFAKVLAWQGKTVESLAEYDRLLQAAPENVDYLVGKAQALVWGGRPADALPLLDGAQKLSPRYEEIFDTRIQALMKLGDDDRLAAARAQALTLFPNAAWVPPAPDRRLADAQAAARDRRLPEAEQLARAWLNDHPGDAEARLLLARVLAWQGKNAEALAEFDRLPAAGEYLIGKAQALVNAGRAADAVPLLRRAIAASPGYEDAYRVLLQALAQAGTREEFAALRAQAVQRFPQGAWPDPVVTLSPATVSVKPDAEDAAATEAIHAALAAGRNDQAETLIRKWMARYPADDSARLLLVRVLTWQGKTADALREADALLQRDAGSPDALLARGQALVRAGRVSEAVAAFSKARAAAPGYEEVYQAEIQALRRLGDRPALDALLKEARQRFAGAPWLQEEPPAAVAGAPSAGRRAWLAEGRPWELESTYAFESLNKGYADWREFSLSGTRALGPRRLVRVGFRETERFSLRDSEISAGLSFPIAARWLGVAEATGSPTHRVLPTWSLMGQVQRHFAGGWDVQLGMRRTDYPAGQSTRGDLGLERYWGSFRAIYTLGVASTEGAGTSVGHRTEVDYYYGDRNSIGLSLGLGDEVESLGPAGVLSSSVFNATLLGRHWFRENWALLYELGWHRQGELYDRQRVMLGVRSRF